MTGLCAHGRTTSATDAILKFKGPIEHGEPAQPFQKGCAALGLPPTAVVCVICT